MISKLGLIYPLLIQPDTATISESIPSPQWWSKILVSPQICAWLAAADLFDDGWGGGCPNLRPPHGPGHVRGSGWWWSDEDWSGSGVSDVGSGDTEPAGALHPAGAGPGHQPQCGPRHSVQKNKVSFNQSVVTTPLWEGLIPFWPCILLSGLVTDSLHVWSSVWPSQTWWPQCRGWWGA